MRYLKRKNTPITSCYCICVFTQVQPKLKLNAQENVTVTFTNPFPVRLTNAVITLEGPGLATPAVKKIK